MASSSGVAGRFSTTVNMSAHPSVRAANFVLQLLKHQTPSTAKHRMWSADPTIVRASATLCHWFYFVACSTPLTVPASLLPEDGEPEEDEGCDQPGAANDDECDDMPPLVSSTAGLRGKEEGGGETAADETMLPFSRDCDIVAVGLAALVSGCKQYGAYCKLKYILPCFGIRGSPPSGGGDNAGHSSRDNFTDVVATVPGGGAEQYNDNPELLNGLKAEVFAYELMMSQLIMRRTLVGRQLADAAVEKRSASVTSVAGTAVRAASVFQVAPYIPEHFVRRIMQAVVPHRTPEVEREILGRFTIELLSKGYQDPCLALFPHENAAAAFFVSFLMNGHVITLTQLDQVMLARVTGEALSEVLVHEFVHRYWPYAVSMYPGENTEEPLVFKRPKASHVEAVVQLTFGPP